MRKPHSVRRGEGMLGPIIGLFLLVIGGLAGAKIIPLHVEGNSIEDSMNEAANFAGVKTVEQLQHDVWRKAQLQNVPLNIEDVKVIRTGPNVNISARYEKSVKVLGFNYKYVFDRKIEKPVF